ncbi:chitin binding peritrophin-A domain-containing protein [Chryseobacterium sp. JUb7]|uniref:chitin binding peritrophin-A domain-containing protein n=1 Tax=Chryseobacterium sp. JUb7 TaxID=2940599 RepID=UPI002167495F|nr:chitin binding peritrophin-A domain-containing protein [Chryseobacterium sp. JUb7]MCS3532825.1 hypothetical protein [Chryseobacterium sp. JUb7]
MKKNLFILPALIFSGFAFSQIGIKANPKPKATFISTGASAKENLSMPEVTKLGAQPNQLLIVCTAPGLFPYPGSADKYYQCVKSSTRWYYYVYNCPAGLSFNPAQKKCVSGN